MNIDVSKATSGQLLTLVKLRGATKEKVADIVRLPEMQARPALEALAERLLKAGGVK